MAVAPRPVRGISPRRPAAVPRPVRGPSTSTQVEAGLAEGRDEEWRAGARAGLAQINGKLDKLQFAGVDGVVTADIEDDALRQDCRDRRKALNRDV